MEAVFAWLALSAVAAGIAADKNRSAFAWFVLSMMLSPVIGILGAIFARRVDDGTSERRRCPECAELVRVEARRCRFCAAELTPLRPPESSALM